MEKALNEAPEVRAAYDRLPYGLRRKHVTAIEKAKSSEVRQRRLARLITSLRSAQL